MTYATLETKVLTVGLRSRIPSLGLQLALENRKLRNEADVVLQPKLRAGKKLAHGAIAYLFGAADTHQIEFPVGHQDIDTANEAQNLHEGYLALLGYLIPKGVLTLHEVDGLVTAYGTDRTILRTESDLDNLGNPGIIAYRDSESQRILDCMTD